MKLEHSHEHDAISRRLAEENKPNYVRDWVYGGIDGAVTTFAIVAGVVGAQLSSGIILVLGLANLLADGFSMAASNYSGTKSEIDDRERLKEIERKHIKHAPDGEREELRQILQAKGLKGSALEEAVEAMADRIAAQPGVLAVYQVGSVSTPGVSDIDMFAVFEDDVPSPGNLPKLILSKLSLTSSKPVDLAASLRASSTTSTALMSLSKAPLCNPS